MRDDYDFSKSTKNPYSKKLKKPVTTLLNEDTIEYFKNLAGRRTCRKATEYFGGPGYNWTAPQYAIRRSFGR